MLGGSWERMKLSGSRRNTPPGAGTGWGPTTAAMVGWLGVAGAVGC